jgi:hypothetical protein
MPHVYLVQPVELVGTNRYKIGMSSLGNLTRVRSYKNGTRYLCIFEKPNALAIEKNLKRAFNGRYKLIGGNEYFQADDESEMIDLFVSTVMGYAIMYPTVKTVVPASQSVEQSADSDATIYPSSWIKKYAFVAKPTAAP